MSTNVDWAIASKLKAVFEALDPCPDKVLITPVGKEKIRPSEGAEYWINLTIKNNSLNIETSNSFVGNSIVEVNLGIESTACLETISETLTERASEVLQTAVYTTLDGYLRRTPTYEIAGYSGGENTNSVYWYTFTLTCEKQV